MALKIPRCSKCSDPNELKTLPSVTGLDGPLQLTVLEMPVFACAKKHKMPVVVLKGARPSGADAKRIAQELRDWVGKEIGAIAKPKDIRFGDNLPKTRSGKIMRRLLRSIAKGEEIKQDVSTLENPAILEQLKQST